MPGGSTATSCASTCATALARGGVALARSGVVGHSHSPSGGEACGGFGWGLRCSAEWMAGGGGRGGVDQSCSRHIRGSSSNTGEMVAQCRPGGTAEIRA
jgi:hypothetical protein